MTNNIIADGTTVKICKFENSDKYLEVEVSINDEVLYDYEYKQAFPDKEIPCVFSKEEWEKVARNAYWGAFLRMYRFFTDNSSKSEKGRKFFICRSIMSFVRAEYHLGNECDVSEEFSNLLDEAGATIQDVVGTYEDYVEIYDICEESDSVEDFWKRVDNLD